ncbi:MAG: hypothetical protein R3A10_11155 [Caldilineaceae bacterium]
MTITYQADEVLDIIKWVWENQDKIGGMTFLPAFDAQYEQMPYEEITRGVRAEKRPGVPECGLLQAMALRAGGLHHGREELACMGGHCDIIWRRDA